MCKNPLPFTVLLPCIVTSIRLRFNANEEKIADALSALLLTKDELEISIVDTI